MLSYLLIFFGAFTCSLLLTPLVKRQAIRLRVFDHPDPERRVHQTSMPRLGGVAIYAALLLASATLSRFESSWPSSLTQLFLPATSVFLLGVVDDVFGIRERMKLAVPALAATLLYVFGWRITGLTFLPGITLSIPDWLGFTLLLLWLVGVTNAVNLIDGVDGLAVGVSAIAVSAVLACSILLGNRESGLMAALLLGALLGFFPYNFSPASIFLGDSGSLLIGFLTASLTLIGTRGQPGTASVVAPVILGLPIVEALVTLLRRWQAGQPLLPGDRAHFHHKLLDRGLSQRQIALRLYAVGAIFAVSGLLLLKAGARLTLLILVLLVVGIVWGVRSLRYVEFTRD